MASTNQVVGNPTPRVEGELKVSGQAKYAVDVTLPGMLWGKLLRSPIASGRIKADRYQQGGSAKRRACDCHGSGLLGPKNRPQTL